MKTYIAERQITHHHDGRPPSSTCRVYVKDAGKRRDLFHVVYHSPTGFNWSYAGSGPADLALSILADHLDEKPGRRQHHITSTRAWQFHQAFKDNFIANADQEGFTLTETEIAAWLHVQEHVAGDDKGPVRLNFGGV